MAEDCAGTLALGERGVYGAEFGWVSGGGPGVCGVCRGMADKRLTPDLLIARIAARQHGVVTASQLLRSGLTRDGVLGRVRAGRLHPVHRGVYAVGHDGLTHHGRWKAATLAVPRGVLSHRSAAELWELLPPSSAKPHLSVPYPASPARRADLTIHRSRTLARTRTTSRSVGQRKSTR